MASAEGRTHVSTRVAASRTSSISPVFSFCFALQVMSSGTAAAADDHLLASNAWAAADLIRPRQKCESEWSNFYFVLHHYHHHRQICIKIYQYM